MRSLMELLYSVLITQSGPAWQLPDMVESPFALHPLPSSSGAHEVPCARRRPLSVFSTDGSGRREE